MSSGHSKLDQINHIVVLMLENRSFDNMLGWLYDPANSEPFKHPPRNQAFAGVSGLPLSNPLPDYLDPSGTRTVPYGKTTHMSSPNPDPGEEYYHVNTQLYGVCNPSSNHWFPFDRPPYNVPDSPPEQAPMSGFVLDYINNLTHHPDVNPAVNSITARIRRATTGKPVLHCHAERVPDAKVYEQIMTGFAPESVPVLATLARQYALCDHWFSAVPSQTFGNRSFVHCGTSRGFVNNSPVHKWLFHSAPTIFNQIHQRGGSFGIFYDAEDVVSFTELLQPSVWPLNSHVHGMAQFFELAAKGALPDYSFIEPRLMLDNNDQHPPAGIPPYLDPIDISSVLAGEQLIANVYAALRNGPGWNNTLLIISYDEHGGNYDHLPPPAAVPPQPTGPVGEQGFHFDRLGVRVPAVVVSPWIEAGKICQTRFDHTSIIRTICHRWDLPHLTERDRQANDLAELLTLNAPRQDYVEVHPHPYHRHTSSASQPLNPYQRVLLALSATMVAYSRFRLDKNPFKKMRDLLSWLHQECILMRIKTQGQAVTYLNQQAGHIKRAQRLIGNLHKSTES